jgi:predicted transcriptional regulator
MKLRKDLPTPTERELEILNILWEHGAATVREVHDKLSPSKPSQYTTTLKLIQIMSEKGLMTRVEKDRSHVYRPVIRRDYVRQKLVSSLMERAFGGSLHKLVVGALGAKHASKEELADLRQLVDEYEMGKKGKK